MKNFKNKAKCPTCDDPNCVVIDVEHRGDPEKNKNRFIYNCPACDDTFRTPTSKRDRRLGVCEFMERRWMYARPNLRNAYEESDPIKYKQILPSEV